MSSYNRFLTEIPTNINTPPFGYKSSNVSSENQYRHYTKDFYGNLYRVGDFTIGRTYMTKNTISDVL